MKRGIPILLLLVAACSSKPVGETESESAIVERAAEIRNQADAELAKQIEDIGATANAEAVDLAETPVNAQ